MAEREATMTPLLAVVDFHHARGPETELWLGVPEHTDPAAENDWSLLPFMALSDGSHTSVEEFSYFTLKQNPTTLRANPTSLFGISCTRQLATKELKRKSADVTRSTVQKAVVVLTEEPWRFAQLRESLSIVTATWFGQKDFSDVEILKRFQESLSSNLRHEENESSPFIGLSLREVIYELRHNTLVLFKCCLLQPKMLFFGSSCERLCMMQFAFVSLIPGLIRHMQDCADPTLDRYADTVSKPTSLKTSERSSLLAYMGLPLQIFGKGSFFGPYTPLQQLDILADYGTKSYIVGSTNSLLLQQKDKYSDILINLDETTVNITSASLRSALSLSAADRRWIDFLTQTVLDTWDPANPSRPNTMGYAGSEEFIQLQFEEYLLALLSSTSYHDHLETQKAAVQTEPPPTPEEDPSLDFNSDFIHAWKQTSNYALFSRLTAGATLSAVVEPKHPTAGGLSVEDVQRRLAQQVAELHLDERVREGKETLNKHLAFGKERFGQLSTKLWADIEAMREAQRARSDGKSSEAGATDQKGKAGSTTEDADLKGAAGYAWPARPAAPDLSHVQATAKDASAKAGAYLSSWGSWARDKSKEWQESKEPTAGQPEVVKASVSPTGTGERPPLVRPLQGIGRIEATSTPTGGTVSRPLEAVADTKLQESGKKSEVQTEGLASKQDAEALAPSNTNDKEQPGPVKAVTQSSVPPSEGKEN